MELNERADTAVELPERPRFGLSELAPADALDPVIEVFKKDLDRTLFAETLKLTSNERSQKFLRFIERAHTR